jgi:ribosomal protein S18 acetylase RimI-like enzyme
MTPINVQPARADDIDELIELESGLFAEDAGRHDPYADPNWPRREGRQDFEDLLASANAVVLVARSESGSVGFLAGYAADASSTRQPVRFAVLRSLYVAPEARRAGAATALIERFVAWATEQGCAEAHVDHYVANQGAASLYERHGFTERSVSRVLPLGPDRP